MDYPLDSNEVETTMPIHVPEQSSSRSRQLFIAPKRMRPSIKSEATGGISTIKNFNNDCSSEILIRNSISDNGPKDQVTVIKEEDTEIVDLTLDEDSVDIK